MLDTAADEEIKDFFLAYSFLLLADKPLSSAESDQQVEAWIKSTLGFVADFDVLDAVKKVLVFGLADEQEGLYSAVDPEVALGRVNDALRELVFV